MSALEMERLQRENAYLKTRCAQLQDDVTDLSSQVTRLQEELERRSARRASAAPNPIAGGQ